MKNKKKKGFTIIELIASVAIFALISISAISMISLGLKYNSLNRESYKSDLFLKSFYETLKPNANRPENQGVGTGISEGTYIFYFNDADNVVSYVKTNFSANTGLTFLTPSSLDPTDENQLKTIIENSKSAGGSNKYVLLTRVRWENTNKMYNINAWTWDKDKGYSSMVNRKFEIRAKS